MNKKKGIICLVGIAMLISGLYGIDRHRNSLYAYDDAAEFPNETSSYIEQSGLFLQMDEEGNTYYLDSNPTDTYDDISLPEDIDPNVTYDVMVESDLGASTVGEYESKEEAVEISMEMEQGMDVSYYGIDATNEDYDISVYTGDVLRKTTKPSVVHFKTTSITIPYYEVGTNIEGYTSASYAQDAAYLGTYNGKVKFKMAGVTAMVDAAYVTIVPYTSNMRMSHYYVNNGKFFHRIITPNTTSDQRVGNAPSYLKQGVDYYSFDGHYFYQSYETMINDYMENTYAHALNASKPYYNYYQFLPIRSKTSFSAADLNKRVSQVTSNTSSKMYNHGKDFINAQKYGVNASLIFGLAANESAWGNSPIAQNKNNIFGLNAVDTSPGTSADTFSSVGVCINDFAKNWVSLGYAEPWDWRYYGAHLGDKQSGMNVKYASDPYWGEKAAAQSYYLEDITGKKDSNKYTIVMETGDLYHYVRKDPKSSSKLLYSTAQSENKVIHQYPFLVLGTVTNSEGTWYKIRTDGILEADRSKHSFEGKTQAQIAQLSGLYEESYNYGYVLASDTMIQVTGGKTIPEEKPKPEDKPKPDKVLPGDVNQDGKLTPSDYVKVKNHIMQTKLLKGKELKAADANQDGKITPADYVVIKNKIMGR